MVSLIKNTLLYCYYLSNIWKQTKRKNKDKIAILMYHGVTTQPFPVWTQVQLSDFEIQMKYVHKNYNPISLDEFVKAARNKTSLPSNSVVVTFDDGFKNNYTTAYPVLKKYQIPATIFLTTSFIDGSNQFEGLIWTDYVMALLLETTKKTFQSPLDDTASIPIVTIDDKIRAKSELCALLKKEPHEKKNSLLLELKKQLEVTSLSDKSALFHGLTWDDVREMDENSLITFGSHTINHEILSRVPQTQLNKEIIDSKEKIEHELKHPISLFAYPNGQPDDYNEAVLQLVHEHYTGAVATIEGLSHINDDLYQLKRLSIGNDTVLWQFKLHLAGVYEQIQSVKKGTL